MRSGKKTMFVAGFFILLVGLLCSACGGGAAESEKLEGSLQDMMASLYANADLVQDFKDNLDSYETIDLTDDLEVSILGTDQITYTEGVVSMPMMSSMAYQLSLIHISEPTRQYS